MNTCKICCVEGHRDVPAEKLPEVRRRLEEEVHRAIADGYVLFISGMEDGVESMFADVVKGAKADHPNIYLEAAVPFANRFTMADGYTERLRQLCDFAHPTSIEETEDSYLIRNRYMLEQSSRVIAVYDGREEGNTVSFLRFAYVNQKELVEIRI